MSPTLSTCTTAYYYHVPGNLLVSVLSYLPSFFLGGGGGCAHEVSVSRAEVVCVAPKKKPRASRAPSHIWTDEETGVFLSLMQGDETRIGYFNTMKLKRMPWRKALEEIAALMKKNGYKVTAVNYDNKWKTPCYTHTGWSRTITPSQANDVLKDCPWHEEMAAILGDKASTSPKSRGWFMASRRHLVESRQCHRPALQAHAQLMSMSTPTTPTRQRREQAFPHQSPQPHQKQDLHRHRGTDQLERNRHHVHKNGLAWKWLTTMAKLPTSSEVYM